MSKGLFLLFSLVFLIGLVSAAPNCVITVNSKTTAQFLTEIPSIDSQLKSCSPDLPSQLSRLTSNGNFFIEVSDAEDFYLTLFSGTVTGISSGVPSKYAYKVVLNSCQLTSILSSNNRVGAFSSYYLSGQARVVGGGLVNKVKLFFVKMFGKSQIKKAAIPVNDCTTTQNKPENCYETYMQGHEQYQFAKEEWDRRLSETGNICQTQTAEMPKGGNCIYLFEQIKNNDKKWLCWYK